MKEDYEIKIDDLSKVKVKTIDSKFSLVYLIYTDRWIDIARIDNFPHAGKQGTHIHRLYEERVEFREMDFEEAVETIIKIGSRIKEIIKNGLY